MLDQKRRSIKSILQRAKHVKGNKTKLPTTIQDTLQKNNRGPGLFIGHNDYQIHSSCAIILSMSYVDYENVDLYWSPRLHYENPCDMRMAPGLNFSQLQAKQTELPSGGGGGGQDYDRKISFLLYVNTRNVQGSANYVLILPPLCCPCALAASL